MSMKFTKVPTDTFEKLQLNAGILLSSFDPASPSVTSANILGATSGGSSFTAAPQFLDFGEDIDNVPKNTKELKRIDYYDVKLSTTFLTVDTTRAKILTGAADIDGTDSSKIVPRAELKDADFSDIWWVGDYSDVNKDSGSGTSATTAGFIAIKVIDALNTSGFSIQSGDKAKGQFTAEFTGHYSIEDEDMTPPFEIYVKKGTQPSS